MAERARLISRATGACIALKDEEEVFFCQASIGTAPDVGVRVNLERGLAAECISSKDMILCNEAQSDPRVDVATRQQLRLGSAVLLPLFAEETLFGVLSVFSDRPHAFGEQQIVRLHDCARTMEKGILRELRGEPEAIPVLPPAVVVLPTQDLTDAEPPDERNRSGHSILRIIVSAVLLCGLLASGVILYQRGIFAPAMPVALKPLVPKPLVPEPTRSQEDPPATPAGPNPVTTPIHTQNATADKPRQQAPYVPVDTFRIYAPKEQRLTEQSPDSAAATKAQDVPVTPAPSAPPSVSRPPVNEAPGPKASTAQQKELQPNPAATPPPSTLAAPPPPVTHVEVLTEVLKTSPTAGPAASTQIPEPESTVKILYPAAAIAQKRQGSVVLRVTVGPAGTVNNIRVLDGDPILSNEAVGAVRQWRYRSTGSDASTELLMTVNFVLSR
jgi:TonB family protein